ncbi:hypothetical protein DAEQUDRAFT_720487 [Daedalea quercina L-15889]|uniref:PIN domain-containing protein n=1 Tax=Daedalea quercina L-15889 TaxID=1314783 RepID=A0A165U2X0_9APHY|nr:hypothetical protein DAEQUDRAFT_720487 [Daedalea quercina L-15889]
MFAQGPPSIGWHSAPMGVLPSPPGQYSPVSSPNAGDASNDDTLQRIYSAANEDVEMKDAFIPDLYLVLDTNVLIDYLDVIKRFNEDIERLCLPITIIIPNVLLSELDGLKKREKIGWFASRASAWILNKMKERKTVHVQARGETVHIDLKPYELERKNDMYIYACCRFFVKEKPLIFVSGDVNLQSTVESINTDSVSRAELFADILTIRPDKKGWSNRDLARKLADNGVNIPGLRVDDVPKYKRSRNTKGGRVTEISGEAVGDGDVDMMDVDQEPPPAEFFIPSHALDALHLQVIDHFTLLLKDLAFRKGAGDLPPPTESRHAPEYRRQEFLAWTVGNCLDYLGSQKPLRPSNPPLPRFLLPKCRIPGTRRGQDWSHQDWKNIITSLEELGISFEDGAILVSVEYLKQEAAYVFSLQLRPTGQ